MASIPTQSTSFLLQGGTVLVHEGYRVNSIRDCDVLIQGSKIASIGQGLALPPGATLIDCRDKLVSPGFIDTHHHVWQSALKGKYGNMSIMEYMVKGSMQSYNCTPEDIFWGQLAGFLQSIDGGVTTVVDHAHVTYSNEHVNEALRATESSGIRAIFCYTLMTRFKEWTATAATIDEEKIPDWNMQGLLSLLTTALWTGTVVRESGVKLITFHYLAALTENVPRLLADYGVLSKDMLISHCCGIAEEDVKLLEEHGVSISATPEVELQTGLGDPILFRRDTKDIMSVGVDCHCTQSSDILSQVRLSLQQTRGQHNAEAQQNKEMPSIKVKLEEAFNLATIKGAEAINLQDEIGSIAVGKRADIVIFDAKSPSLICAAQENPLDAILLHSSIRDIDIVIVDGKIRKRRGILLPIELVGRLNESPNELISWQEVADHLLESRLKIQERAKDQNFLLALQALKDWF